MLRTTLFVIAAVGLAACGGGDSGTGSESADLDLDDDGILNAVDACPNQPETVNGVYDSDGCPDTVAEFYDDVRADVEAFWVASLTGSAFPYRPITVFTSYTTPINTACGLAELGNAFYCPLDEGVYYDFNFLQLFLDGVGDMAPAFIISHEIGHHVSNILGWADPGVISPKELELQADCFGGAWVGSADARMLLEEGDAEETIAALILIGDPDDTWFRPDLHGTSAQRVIAFLIGAIDGAAACTELAFFDLFPAPEK